MVCRESGFTTTGHFEWNSFYCRRRIRPHHRVVLTVSRESESEERISREQGDEPRLIFLELPKEATSTATSRKLLSRKFSKPTHPVVVGPTCSSGPEPAHYICVL